MYYTGDTIDMVFNVTNEEFANLDQFAIECYIRKPNRTSVKKQVTVDGMSVLVYLDSQDTNVEGNYVVELKFMFESVIKTVYRQPFTIEKSIDRIQGE